MARVEWSGILAVDFLGAWTCMRVEMVCIRRFLVGQGMILVFWEMSNDERSFAD